MEAMALTVMAFRQVLTDEQWARRKNTSGYLLGVECGLALMVAGNLFPGGVMQFYDVLTNGYWHARGLDYLNQEFVQLIEWCRMPGDMVFIVLGVIPMVIAAGLTYLDQWKTPVIEIRTRKDSENRDRRKWSE